MAVRAFDGTGDFIDFAIPAGLDITTQAFTVVAVGKRAVNTAWHTYISWQTSGNSYRLALDITNADRLGGATQTTGLTQTSGNSSGGAAPFTIQSGDGWTIAIWSKPASTGAGTFSVFKGGAWTHTASNLGSQGQPGTANPSGKITVGRFEAVDDYYNGRLATIAVWVGTELSQGQKESLAGGSASAWSSVASGPTEQWEFNQAAWATQVVGLKGLASSSSISGNGTIVTGDDPAGTIYNFAGGDATVTAVPAVALGSAPIAAVSAAGNATVTAVTATALGSAPIAAVAAGATVTAVVADALGSAPPANQITSAVVTAPAVMALGSAPPASVGAGGDATVTAVIASALGSAPIASLSAGQVVAAVVADATGAATASTISAGATVGAVPALALASALRPAITPAPAGGGGTALVAVAFAEDAA